MQPKLPPHNVELECAILGRLMVDPDAWGVVENILKPDDFYRRDHQDIFAACASLLRANKVCDALTVGEHLRVQGIGNEREMQVYLYQISLDAYSSVGLEAHARLVADHSKRRHMIALCSSVIETAYSQYADQAVAQLSVGMERLQRSVTGRAKSFAEIMDITDAALTETTSKRAAGGMLGAPTGLPFLDKRTGGLCPPRFWIVAARPSLGKSALLNQIGMHAAGHGFPGYIASLEMTDEEIGYRARAAAARVNVTRLSFGDPDARLRSDDAAGRLGALPLFIDTDSYHIQQICAQIAEMKRKHGIAWAAVDHIGLIETDDIKNRNEQLSFISRTIKKMTRSLNIPIIAMSQLNRNVEKERRRPQMSDLRDSGSLEQDADIVLFMHSEGDDNEADKPMQFGFGKNRGGRRGWLKERIVFRGAFQRFEEVADEPQDERSDNFEFRAPPPHDYTAADAASDDRRDVQ